MVWINKYNAVRTILKQEMKPSFAFTQCFVHLLVRNQFGREQ